MSFGAKYFLDRDDGVIAKQDHSSKSLSLDGCFCSEDLQETHAIKTNVSSYCLSLQSAHSSVYEKLSEGGWFQGPRARRKNPASVRPNLLARPVPIRRAATEQNKSNEILLCKELNSTTIINEDETIQ